MKTVKGDILSVAEGIICHGCNTSGVMGAGLALQIKNKYPKAFDEYEAACQRHTDKELIGKWQYVEISNKLTIGNMFTQIRIGDPVRSVSYDAIDDSFRLLASFNNQQDDIHVPQIGAGLANGHWPVIKEIIEFHVPEATLWIYE